jgi:hypothetical protein
MFRHENSREGSKVSVKFDFDDGISLEGAYDLDMSGDITLVGQPTSLPMI